MRVSRLCIVHTVVVGILGCTAKILLAIAIPTASKLVHIPFNIDIDICF